MQQFTRRVGADRDDVIHDAHQNALRFVGRRILVIAVGESHHRHIDAEVLRDLSHDAFGDRIGVIEARLPAGHTHRDRLTRQQHLKPGQFRGAFLEFREALRLEFTEPHDHARRGAQPEIRERDGAIVRRKRDPIRRRHLVRNTERRQFSGSDRRDTRSGDREGRPDRGHIAT